MITNEYIADWLKTVFEANMYCGFLSSKKEKSIGIYNLKRSGMDMAIGGPAATLTHSRGVTFLIHWTNSTRETENAAYALYEALKNASEVTINNHKVSYIQLLQNEPIPIGLDSSGIMEYSIDAIIWYQK